MIRESLFCILRLYLQIRESNIFKFIFPTRPSQGSRNEGHETTPPPLPDWSPVRTITRVFSSNRSPPKKKKGPYRTGGFGFSENKKGFPKKKKKKLLSA